MRDGEDDTKKEVEIGIIEEMKAEVKKAEEEMKREIEGLKAGWEKRKKEMRSEMAVEMAEMKTTIEQKVREESAAEIEALKAQVEQLKKEKKGLKGYSKAIVAQKVKLEEEGGTENKALIEACVEDVEGSRDAGGGGGVLWSYHP